MFSLGGRERDFPPLGFLPWAQWYIFYMLLNKTCLNIKGNDDYFRWAHTKKYSFQTLVQLQFPSFIPQEAHGNCDCRVRSGQMSLHDVSSGLGSFCVLSFPTFRKCKILSQMLQRKLSYFTPCNSVSWEQVAFSSLKKKNNVVEWKKLLCKVWYHYLRFKKMPSTL